MKKVICTIAIIIAAMSLASAQERNTNNSSNYTREGNSFVQGPRKTSQRASKDQPTTFTWTDSKGVTYPIFLHTYERGEKAGRTTAYVVKTSKKTGKEYKYYLPDGEAVAAEILGRQ